MNKKKQRLSVIRELIAYESVSSQEELLSKLAQAGIESTQSTLSRDIKELNAIKVPHLGKGYVYVMPESIRGKRISEKASSMVTDNVCDIAFSGNIAVLKCKSGFANPVALIIDSEFIPQIVGTVAGDDTVLIVMAEGVDSKELIEVLTELFPNIALLKR